MVNRVNLYQFFSIEFVFTVVNCIIIFMFFLTTNYDVSILILIIEKHIEFLFFLLLLRFGLSIERNFVLKMFLISITVRIMYGIFNYKLFSYFQGYPMSTGNSFYDEYTYYSFAKEFYSLVFNNSIFDMASYVNFPVNYMGYPYFMSWIYYLLGPRNYWHIAINPIFMSLSGVVFYFLLKKATYLNHITLKIFLILFLFFPETIYFSTLNLKDSILIFLLSVSFYSAYNLLHKNFFYLPLFLISTYLIYFFRVQFMILPLLFLLLLGMQNLRGFTLSIFSIIVLITTVKFNFIKNLLPFFGWEHLYIVYSKIQKWNLVKSFGWLLPLVIISFFLMGIVLPLPILFPLPPSTDTKLSTEIFKIPIDLEYSVVFSMLLYYLFSKSLFNDFKYLLGNLPYFKFVTFIFIMLVVSNYITYERHKMIFEIFLYIPLAFILYNIFLGKLKLRLYINLRMLIEVLTLYFTYTRGVAKGVF